MCGRLYKHAALSLLIAVGALAAAEARSQSVAQCPPGGKVFVDPRLVPQREKVTRDQFVAVMANPYVPDYVKKQTNDAYFAQHQPIQVPFGSGMVMISADDPCVQQYIGP